MAETPYLTVEANLDTSLRIDTPQYQAFLAWLRAEGITPENVKRIEVFEAKRPYAIVTLYELDDKGGKVWDEVTEEAVTYTDIVPLSSLPPLQEV